MYKFLPKEWATTAAGGGKPEGVDEGDGGVEEILDGSILEGEGVRVRAVHCPGHTEDHVAFVLEKGEEDEGAMFTGDSKFYAFFGSPIRRSVSSYHFLPQWTRQLR